MFDGIAGVYDLLNTAMTAGLHHRWRERAADLARVGPAVACSTWRPAPATWRSSSPRRVAPDGEVLGSDFAEGMLARARRQGGLAAGLVREPALRVGRCAGALPYDDDAFDAATVGFGARNFADLARGLAEMARVVRPGRPRRRARDHHADVKPPLSLFYAPVVRSPRAGARARNAVGRARAVAAASLAAFRRGLRRRDDRRRLRLPAQLGQALSGAGGARGGDGARRPARDRLRAGGRRDRRDPRRHGRPPEGRDERRGQHAGRRRGGGSRRRRDDHATRRRALRKRMDPHGAAPGARHGAGRRAAGVARERDDPRGRQAPAPAAGGARGRVGGRAAGHARTARSAWCARRSRSSWCTRRRSSTTT